VYSDINLYSVGHFLAKRGSQLQTGTVDVGLIVDVWCIFMVRRRRMMNNPICPQTGVPMRRDVRPMTITYRGESLTFDIPGWYTDASDESIHTGEDMKVSDRMLNRLKARVEGLLEPEEIRRIRKKLGLSQTAAGEIIGGGPRAFQKYEAGDLLPSRAISSALTLLDSNPEGLKILRTTSERTSSHTGYGKVRGTVPTLRG
jgi:HTH-type transcriptional regulator / antitoxin MqsA